MKLASTAVMATFASVPSVAAHRGETTHGTRTRGRALSKGKGGKGKGGSFDCGKGSFEEAFLNQADDDCDNVLEVTDDLTILRSKLTFSTATLAIC